MDNSVKNFFENCENNELTLINLDEVLDGLDTSENLTK